MPPRRTKKRQVAKELWLPTPEEIEAAKVAIREEWVKAPSECKKYQYRSPYVRVVKVGN